MKKIKYLLIAIVSVAFAFSLFFLLFISFHKNSGLVQNGKKANIEDKNPKKDFTNSDSSDPTKVEQNNSIVSFESENDKNLFIKNNSLVNKNFKQITGTNSYKIDLSQKQISKLNYQDKIKVYPNVIYRATATPNDELYSQQWNLTKVSAPLAWDISKSSATIKIAVIDTGCDFNHSDYFLFVYIFAKHCKNFFKILAVYISFPVKYL